MIHCEFDNMDSIYRHICDDIIFNSNKVSNTRELSNYSFTLTNLDNNVINIRNISQSYMCAELLWYALARNDVRFINTFAGLWGRISDDGVTSYSAYGDIVYKRHGFDQFEKVIELLKTDKNSRRAVINFNVPNTNVIETRDEICTIALQFYIRDNKLYCTGIMRSNDIWYGLPYDVIFFTELQKLMAKRLNVEVGSYTHFVISLHAYDRNHNDIVKASTAKATTKLHIDYEKMLNWRFCLEEAVEESNEPRKTIVKECKYLNILTDVLGD